MPVYLDEIAKNTAKVTFAVGDGEANVVYRPALITEETFATLQAFERMGESDKDVFDAFKEMNEMIVYLVESWDIYKNKDTLFPLDVEQLPKMHLGLRLQVIQEIMGDFRPESPGVSSTPTPISSN